VIRLAIVGNGKMGHAVAALAPEHGFQVVALLGASDVKARGITEELLADADVAVEFSVPRAAPDNIRQLAAAGCPVVSGTTGWDDQRARVEADVRAAGGALLWSPNFALGVHLFGQVVKEAGRRFRAAPGFDAHMLEVHHKAKKDAPSGTAKRLAELASRGLGRDVPITSIRTGQVPGTHSLLFDGPFEQVRLEHVARDRRVFAVGALIAAKWLARQTASGIYSLDDVLGPGEGGEA
jgi:4-hydroxy-tetrahydrodipicolinate reductase